MGIVFMVKCKRCSSKSSRPLTGGYCERCRKDLGLKNVTIFDQEALNRLIDTN